MLIYFEKIVMNGKKVIIDRFNVLQAEAGQTENEFRKTLSFVTGKTPRTIRRWYAQETTIHEGDLKLIAEYFGQHENWLKLGDQNSRQSITDQIIASNHFGVVVTNNGQAENMNHKFLNMMGLDSDHGNEIDIFNHLLNIQSEQTLTLYNVSTEMTEENGFHHHNMTVKLGNGDVHCMNVTTLNINNGKLLRIFMDMGQIVRTHRGHDGKNTYNND